MTSDETTFTMRARDGAMVAFTVYGDDRTLPVVALVHSLAMDHRFWTPVACKLADVARVVAIDARGHGRSELGEEPLTVRRMADDLLEVIDHLEVNRVVVGGASMGGCVALQFAGVHAERTSGLALIDTTAWYGPTAVQDWEDRAVKAQAGGFQAMADFQRTRWFSDAFREADPLLVQECMDTFVRNDIRSYMAACRMLGAFDGRGLLEGIEVPTAILVGEEDYAAPVAMAKVMNDGVRGSTLKIIPRARHLTPLEVPDVVAACLTKLCRGGRT